MRITPHSPALRHRAGHHRIGAVVAAAVLAAVTGAGVAGATTGPGYLIKPPRYRISLKVLKAYSGRYVTTSAAAKSGIQSSELYIGVAESGYAAGGISIYSYNSAGTLQSFAGTLYDFHLVGGGKVEADIVGAGGEPVLGHLFFVHKRASKNIVGTIIPPGGGGPYAIAYRESGGSTALPGQANFPVPGPPNPGVVSGKALNSNGNNPSTPTPKPISGWGPTGRFLGRYHVVPGAPAAPASQPAGIFTVALNTAARLSVTAQVPTGGQLSMFMRTVKKTLPPEPSGILSLQTPSGNAVVYLTMLTSAGLTRKAEVHGGSFLGPQIGTFSGTSATPGTLSGTITATGLGTFKVGFRRFSTSPTP
jgi:hypothetical protein